MLKINMEYRKGILFIRLKGELTKYNYEKMTNNIIFIIKEKGIKYIVFNLQELQIMDIYGKNSIKKIIESVNNNSGSGLICNTKVKFEEKYPVIDNELVAFKTIMV